MTVDLDKLELASGGRVGVVSLATRDVNDAFAPVVTPAVVLELIAEVRRLRAENFALAAGQCPVAGGGLVGDEHGDFSCRLRTLLAEAKEALALISEHSTQMARFEPDTHDAIVAVAAKIEEALK